MLVRRGDVIFFHRVGIFSLHSKCQIVTESTCCSLDYSNGIQPVKAASLWDLA